MTKRQRLAAMWRRKAPLWSVLSLFSIIGVFLIILPAVALFDQAGITRELSRDIGIAFVTASLLGVSVDIFLKRGIARDAFEGAVGYILPLEVKEAVHTLARMTWFAEEFSLVVNLNLVEDDLIKATIKIRKMVRNIGDIPQPITSYIQVDEWGRRYQSEVISCEIKTASGKVVATFNKDEVQVIGSSFKGETDEYMVGSGELVELLAEGVEYKHANDDIHYSLAYLARDPEIYIDRLPGFEINGDVSTYSRHQKHPHLIHYKLQGVYFPHQRMLARWYPSGSAPDSRPRYN